MQLLYNITVSLLTLIFCCCHLSTATGASTEFSSTFTNEITVTTVVSSDITTDATSISSELITGGTSISLELTTSDVSISSESATSTASISLESTTSGTSIFLEPTTSDISISSESSTSTLSISLESTTSDVSVSSEGITSGTTISPETATSTVSISLEPTTSDVSMSSEGITSGITISPETATSAISTSSDSTASTMTVSPETTISSMTLSTMTVTDNTVTSTGMGISITSTSINTASSSEFSAGTRTTIITSSITTVTIDTASSIATTAITSMTTTNLPSSPTLTTTTTTSTASSLLVSLLECDFSNDCVFSGTASVNVTNGSRFESDIRSNPSEEPRVPVSGAPSIRRSNNSIDDCQLPYNLSQITSLTHNWDMWFCFDNKCPSKNSGQLTTCSAANYGLVSFGTSDSSQTATIPVSPRNRNNEEPREQCLLYYYYMTFGDSPLVRNQSIDIYMSPDGSPVDPIRIDAVTRADMKENAWQNRTVKVNSSSNSYQLTFVFNANPGDGDIYFALDSIELYDNNCAYVQQVKNPTTASPPSDDNNLGLILGLSLGLGIPVIAGVLGGGAYYFLRKKREDRYLTSGIELEDRRTYPDYQYVENDGSTTFF